MGIENISSQVEATDVNISNLQKKDIANFDKNILEATNSNENNDSNTSNILKDLSLSNLDVSNNFEFDDNKSTKNISSDLDILVNSFSDVTEQNKDIELDYENALASNDVYTVSEYYNEQEENRDFANVIGALVGGAAGAFAGYAFGNYVTKNPMGGLICMVTGAYLGSKLGKGYMNARIESKLGQAEPANDNNLAGNILNWADNLFNGNDNLAKNENASSWDNSWDNSLDISNNNFYDYSKPSTDPANTDIVTYGPALPPSFDNIIISDTTEVAPEKEDSSWFDWLWS